MGIKYKNKIYTDNVSTYRIVDMLDFSYIDKSQISNISIIRAIEQDSILTHELLSEQRNIILSKIRSKSKYILGHNNDERFDISLKLVLHEIYLSIQWFNEITDYINIHYHTHLKKIRIYI